jgi:N-acetylmuramoyl-L-alanine amidase CwlA
MNRLNLKQCYITKNDCYKAGRIIVPKGIMVHSTATPGIMAEGWFSRWNKSGIDTAVHAFLDDKVICQHLPWTHRAWHCGSHGNNTHIAFELCEPKNRKTNQTYFKACYENAVELAAFLCKKFSLTEKNIISHKEGYQKGIASNHGDPDHWWSCFGYTMDMFRADVKKKLDGKPIAITPAKKQETLTMGCIGTEVKKLQKRLNLMRIRLALAFNTLEEDGVFGQKTKEAVRAFQSARNLSVDGIVGEKTRTTLSLDYGDVNGDDKADAVDALTVLQSAINKKKLTDKQTKTADMNADGKVDAIDAKDILQQAVKKR